VPTIRKRLESFTRLSQAESASEAAKDEHEKEENRS
jgi:hypothetical protein